MSAFILPDSHIHAMLSSIRNADDQELTRLGQILVDQNVRSVNYRYRHSPHIDQEESRVYRFRRRMPLPPVAVIKACNCYEYQSCETPDWEGTEACRITQRIESEAIHKLPGYADADWVID